MFASGKNACIKDLNALRIFMIFFIYLFMWRTEGGGALMHVYV